MSSFTKRLMLAIAVFFTAGIMYSAPAAAQATRTWVSGVGDDANPCSRTAPCKTFAGAISKTAAGGEINCLDPAGFGTVTIVKSMTIDCTGTFGSALSSSTTGIIINATAAGDTVVLRGLSINGAPPSAPGINGVRVLAAAKVLIENVKILGFGGAVPNGYGIIINPTAGNVQVTVINSTISNNGNGGIQVVPAAAVPVDLYVSHTEFNGNGGAAVGLTTAGGGTVLTAVITNSSITGSKVSNSGGVIAKASTGTASIVVSGTTIANVAGTAVTANGAGASVRIGTSTIAGNATAINAVNGGTVVSFGNNQLSNNTAPGAFSSTTTTN